MISLYFSKRVILAIKRFLKVRINLFTIAFIVGVISFYQVWVAAGLLSLLLILRFQLLKILFAALLILAGNYTTQKTYLNAYKEYNSSEQVILGTIIYQPILKEFNSEIILQIEGYYNYFFAKTFKYLNLEYLDKVEFSGKIVKIENLKNSEFDFKQYNLSRRVSYEIKDLKIISIQKSNDLLATINKAKISLVNKINESLPEPDSSLINGILLGESNSIDESLKENLKNSGVYHIVSISGFNVSIIFAAIMLAAKKIVNRRKAILFSILSITIFMLFIGTNNLPVIRATIMLTYISIGLYFGYKTSSLTSLLVATSLTLILYPFYIINLSMLLSTFATLGIILISRLGSNIKFDQEYLQNNLSDFRTSIAATTSTSVITFLTFKEVNFTGIITNFFILPFVPLLMMLGLLVTIFKFINLNQLVYLDSVIIHSLLGIIYVIDDFIANNFKISFSSIVPAILILFIIIVFDYYVFKKKHFRNHTYIAST